MEYLEKFFKKITILKYINIEFKWCFVNLFEIFYSNRTVFILLKIILKNLID